MTISHKHFEMGTAPYRYISLWTAPSTSLQEFNPTAYNRAASDAPICCKHVCDHCGTGIMNHFIIEDANGICFAIGSDCLGKIDDVENLTAAELDRKDHLRKLNRIRSKAKAEAKRVESENELTRQRFHNGGMTDWEVTQQKRVEALDVVRAGAKIRFAYFLEALDANDSDFCRSVARNIVENNCAPTGRALHILLDITAKHYSGARKNSKAFNSAFDTADEIMESIQVQ